MEPVSPTLSSANDTDVIPDLGQTDPQPNLNATDDIISSTLADVYNTTDVDQSLQDLVSNVTNNLELDTNFTQSQLDLGNATFQPDLNATQLNASSDNSTFNAIFQTVRDSLVATTESPPDEYPDILDAEVVTISTPHEPGGFTSMQKWFLATGVLFGAVIVLWCINCILQCKDSVLKQIERQRFDRRVKREMAVEGGDTTQTHMFVHPFFSKGDS